MERRSFPGRAAILAATVLALTAARAGAWPPWLSIEAPPNPYDRMASGAVLLVHTYFHDPSPTDSVLGTAEGLVGGKRQSIPLAFRRTDRPGVFALGRQWPSDGIWLLVIETSRKGDSPAAALVQLGSGGEVEWVRGTVGKSDLSRAAIDSLLATRATRLAAK